jgi:hypothetical protein
MSDTVLVSKDDLQSLLDYIQDSEYSHFLEYVEEHGSGEGHILARAFSIQEAINSQA